MKTTFNRRRPSSAKADERGTVQIIVHLVDRSKHQGGIVKGNRSWSISVYDAKVSEVAEAITKIIEDR